jgi:threonine dehydratase
VEALKLIFERMKLVVEPSAALVLAALLEDKKNVQGLRVGLILSGGNVDLKKLPFLS